VEGYAVERSEVNSFCSVTSVSNKVKRGRKAEERNAPFSRTHTGVASGSQHRYQARRTSGKNGNSVWAGVAPSFHLCVRDSGSAPRKKEEKRENQGDLIPGPESGGRKEPAGISAGLAAIK